MKLYYLFAALLLRKHSPKYNFDYPEVWRDESIVDEYHGVQIHDPYRWLEDLDSPETQRFVKEQNDLTIPYCEACPSKAGIHDSLWSLANYTQYFPPLQRGSTYIYFETSGLKNQRLMYVKDGLEGEPRVLVDPNNLASDGTTTIAQAIPSNDGEIIAYGLSQKGSDWFTVHFIYSRSGKALPDALAKTKFTQLSWGIDGQGIFYSRWPYLENRTELLETTQDEHEELFYHRLGTPQSEDVRIASFQDNPTWACYGEVTHDGKYFLVFTEEELGPVQMYYVDLEELFRGGYPIQPDPPLKVLVKEFDAEYYYVTSLDSLLIFRTNKNAPNWRIVGINIHNPQESQWEIIVPEDPRVVLTWAVAINDDQMVLSYTQDVKSTLQLWSLQGRRMTKNYDVDVGTIWQPDPGVQRSSTELFLKFESLLTPGKIYHLDFKSSVNRNDPPALTIYRESRLEGFDPRNYTLTQHFYTSKDTTVPMFIAHKKDIILGSETPCILYGYGGFNTINHPNFELGYAMFMKNFNGIVVYANIRGGGEYGINWYNEGRLLNKQNTFDDFEAAAEYLIETGYTSSKKLTIHGISNGGLLVATSINQRPDLFGAGISEVGVMDMLRFHKFTTGGSWTSDYGSSDNKTQFETLLKYSPLHNVRAPLRNSSQQQYPATLLVTADHDDRVVPSHSFKLIAQLQYVIGRRKAQENPLFLRVETNAGHGSGKPLYKQIEGTADIFSFICHALNLEFKE